MSLVKRTIPVKKNKSGRILILSGADPNIRDHGNWAAVDYLKDYLDKQGNIPDDEVRRKRARLLLFTYQYCICQHNWQLRKRNRLWSCLIN